MRISYLICVGAAVLASACDPTAFDALTRGIEDGGADGGALDAQVDEDGGLVGDDDDAGTEGDAGLTPSEGGIILPTECEGGETICESSSTQRSCVEGFWSELEVCEQACIGSACGGRCTPGDRQCSDKQPQRCDDDGEWVDDGAPCESVCDDGACEGACAPDATQCVSSTRLQTCDENGSWGETSTCPFACVGQACGGECVPGSRQCVMQTPQRAYEMCNTEGQWSEPSMCIYVCGDGGECGGECVPGTRSCMNNAPHECSAAGGWVPEAACAGARPVCVGAGECRCRPGTVRCGGDGTQPQVCNEDNAWQNVGVPCANCEAGRCNGEGCSETRIMECGAFGAACVNNECGGGFGDTGDGCSNARRSACADAGCGCVDGACSGGFCDGSGCTAREALNCDAFGCGCYLKNCSGGACGG